MQWLPSLRGIQGNEVAVELQERNIHITETIRTHHNR